MSVAIKTVRIIGIGSPLAGDEAGMQLVDRLRQDVAWQTRDEIDWVVLERPGATLLQYLNGVETVCLIDALDSDDHHGVVRIKAESLLAETGSFSSHQFGVAETLQLANTLQQLPARLLIYGIASGALSKSFDELSAMLKRDLAIKIPATALCGS